MKRLLLLAFAALLAAGPAHAADEKKADAKKSAKAKAKSAAKKSSDKNVFQKAESSIGDFAHKHKIWTRSEGRGGKKSD